MNKSLVIGLLSLSMLSAATARGENWPSWRGPLHGGVVPGKGYPVEWGEDKNTLWKVKLPGWGTSTPAIWSEQIFASTVDEGNNALICLNLQGEKQWQAAFGSAAGNKNSKASGANPSPITDGKHVYAYYKSGDLACVDFAGKTVWQINLQDNYGRDRMNWDLGTSPVLTSRAVVVAVMHMGPSYVVAIDKSTGDVLWKHDRDLGAPAESQDSYTTPLVIEDGDREIVVVLGADHVTAHEADSGKELWRVGELNPRGQRNFRSIASPVVAGDLIVAPYARGNTLTAIRRGGSGNITQSHVAWTAHGASADVPCPVFYDGKIYVCGDRGDVTCVDPASGDEVWTERLPRNRFPYSSSPMIAEGRLYATREDGATFVLKLGDKPELLAENVLNEYTYATPAFANGRIYLRTSEYLVCVGEK